jgi:hypothetical protein
MFGALALALVSYGVLVAAAVGAGTWFSERTKRATN